MIRIRGRLGTFLGARGQDFLDHTSKAIARILPHVTVTAWEIRPRAKAGAFWQSNSRDEIRIDLSVGPPGNSISRTLSARVRRKQTPFWGSALANTLDTQEHNLCKIIARLTSDPLEKTDVVKSASILVALHQTFDEQVVAAHLQEHHGLKIDVQAVLRATHQLAGQTYENQALAFGCLLDPNKDGNPSDAAVFPEELFRLKKYRALSDGFRTAYHISGNGRLLGFIDLERYRGKPLSSRHFSPYWSANFARASQHGICGVSLTRNGDILIFDEGTLRFTYRRGHWQYWNHSHLIALLADLARTQHVPPKRISGLVRYLYTSALDVSFRHSGGLFLLLRNEKLLGDLVQPRDVMHGPARAEIDLQFDRSLPRKIPPPVLVELAALDGAIVIANSKKIRAHGAILKQSASSNRYKAEGSRTKAAVGASNFGLAIKISSDGDITVFHNGKEFIQIGG